MPEGDTIFRAARTLHHALAGRKVTTFESVFPALTRVDHDTPVAGRTIDRVWSAGKHLLVEFSGALVLRTHMRMHGSWHVYRSGERWWLPRSKMRIVIGTDAFVAVAFAVPVAEFIAGRVERHRVLGQLGPDLLSDPFDQDAALARLRARDTMLVADALLDQRALAGIGNVYKSEICFLCGVYPFAPVADVSDERLTRLVETARRLLRANVAGTSGPGIVTYAGVRRTTGRADPAARLWVYGRRGRPCRRCGTPIRSRKTGPAARSTYWCERCQRT
jgi:endonuclease VIII